MSCPWMFKDSVELCCLSFFDVSGFESPHILMVTATTWGISNKYSREGLLALWPKTYTLHTIWTIHQGVSIMKQVWPSDDMKNYLFKSTTRRERQHGRCWGIRARPQPIGLWNFCEGNLQGVTQTSILLHLNWSENYGSLEHEKPSRPHQALGVG